LKLEKEVVGIYISGHPLDDFKTEMKTFCKNKLSDFQQIENFVNRDMTFGGVVTDVQHRVSKNGKGWAVFTVEDYNDNFEFRIFGEEYLKFRHLLIPNGFLYAKVFVKEGFVNRETGQKGDPRIQFSLMQMLQDVLDVHAKKITIHLKMNELASHRVEKLKEVVQKHKGNHNLHFHFYEPEGNIHLQTNSRKHKMKISQELLHEL